ncbi:MAG: hypothetical protein WC916_00775 [Candidatus Woesearchaeota archaeon]
MDKIAVVVGEKNNYYNSIWAWLNESGYTPFYLNASLVDNISGLEPDLIIQEFPDVSMNHEREYAIIEETMNYIKSSTKDISLLVLDALPNYSKAVELPKLSQKILSGSKVQFAYGRRTDKKEKFAEYLACLQKQSGTNVPLLLG